MTMSLMKMLTITIIKHELKHQLIDSTENVEEIWRGLGWRSEMFL